MSRLGWVNTALVVLTAILLIADIAALHKNVRAQDNQEIAPYKFADLPHGRIYKAVHEGCELFIVEGSMRVAGAPDAGYFYTITTGRGCR